MVLSPALNIRSARGPIYDADALAFCRASGATARKAISDFVKGVKALGLWNSMVCWPLRSSQNAGTGTTAYSLGGLGTFNGTLVNGPTWGSDGVAFDGSNDRLITPLEASDYSAGLSQLVVFNAATDTQSFSMFFGDEGDGGASRHGTMMRRNGSNNEIGFSTNLTGGLVAVAQAVTFGQWNAVHNRLVAPSSFLSVNSASETIGTGSGTFSISPITEDRVGFGARQKATTPGFHAKMTAAFGAFWSSGTSASQMQAVKSLYKSTLGTGLGLP